MELPRIEELYKKYAGRNLSVIALQSNQERELASKVIRENGLTFHLLQNEEGNDVVHGLLGIDSFPASYIVDREGRIMYYHVGYTKGDEAGLEREILELLDS